jgi:ATP-binding cassette subfamily B multidrug efflux pump
MAKRSRTPASAAPGSAASAGVASPSPASIELDEEYTPTEADGGMFGSTPGKKAQNFLPSAQRLIGLLRPERARMIIVVALVVVSVVLTVLAPKILGQAMDAIFNGVIGMQLPKGVPLDQVVAQARANGNTQFADMLQNTSVVPGEGVDFTVLGRLILVVLAMYTIASVLSWAQGYILNRLVMRVVFRLRQDIEEKLNRLPLSYFDTRQRGDLMSRVTNDVDNIQQPCSRPSPSWCSPCSRCSASPR